MKNKDQPKEPKDLGVKIGTKTEALWTRVRDEAKTLIDNSNNNLIVQKEMLKLAEKKLSEESK